MVVVFLMRRFRLGNIWPLFRLNGSSRTTNALYSRIDEVAALISRSFGDTADLIMRRICTGRNGGIRVLVVYLDGLVDRVIV